MYPDTDEEGIKDVFLDDERVPLAHGFQGQQWRGGWDEGPSTC